MSPTVVNIHQHNRMEGTTKCGMGRAELNWYMPCCNYITELLKKKKNTFKESQAAVIDYSMDLKDSR